MKMREVTRVYESTEYENFVPNEYNRDVKQDKLLAKSMHKHGFDSGLPIRVVRRHDGKFSITHGHHRFDVAVSLGIPVRFVIADADIDLFDSEASTRPWNLSDYVNARARAGENAPAEVIAYHERTGIPLGMCVSLLGGDVGNHGNKAKMIKRGSYKVRDSELPEIIEVMVCKLKLYGIEFATNVYFLNALSKCLMVEEFDKDIFLRKVKTYASLMEKQRSQDAYLELIEEVYNRNAKTNKIPLKFMAEQASKKRQATFGK